MRRSSQHSVLHRSVRGLWIFIKYTAAVWLFSVVVFRFLNPPLTPLMIIRGIQSLASDAPTIPTKKWVPLSSIPQAAQQAIVAAEDARFMDHWGIDVLAVENAVDEKKERRRVRGASTITMQTVKNVFLWPGRSYVRKALEALMAPVAGVVWGKRRTLEIYLNVIEWGQGLYGIEAASQHYFRHSASQLTVAEAAALAAILPNPRKLSPERMTHPTRRRYERVLRQWNGVRVPAVVTAHPVKAGSGRRGRT